jgi:hypothetical protein
MSKVRYNRDLLDSCMERDGAILIGEYEKLTCETQINFKCKCEELNRKSFKLICNKSRAFCKKCSMANGRVKFSNTIIEKFGVSHISQSQEIKDKKRETCLKNYGVDNPMKSKEVKDSLNLIMKSQEVRNKIKETCLKKYGVDNHMKAQEVKDKIKETNNKRYGVDSIFHSEEVKDKIKETTLNKYGVSHISKSKDIRDKIKSTNKEKYGVDNVLKKKEFRDKAKQTNLKKYGFEYAIQNQEVKDKIKETNNKRYGVDNPMQNSEVSLRVSKRAYKLKDYILPNNEVVKVQGYEPMALDKIFKEWRIDVNDVILDRDEVPEIWWFDDNGNKRRYFPDIFIITKNLIIEVKSNWTFYKKQKETQNKLQATRELGYNTILWVINNKGDILREYNNCTFEIQDKIKENDIQV